MSNNFQAQDVDNSNSKKTLKQNKIFDIFIRIFLYGTLLVAIFLCFFATPLFNKINIMQAEACFAQQDYVCAFKFYRKAFASRLNNEVYVENYFNTLAKMKKIAVVQQELENLLEDYPFSDVAPQIEAIFAQIRKDVEKQYEQTYIDAVAQGTSIVHWNNVAQKVRVFIDNQQAAQLPGYYISEVKEAFLDYSRLLEHSLQFTYVNSAKDADIVIVFMPEISGGKCIGTSDCLKILGLTENVISGSILHKSLVKLRTQDVDGSQFTANQIHNIAKHEIGHALGVAGHSYFSEDVMYPVNNDAHWAEDNQTLLIEKKVFSQRDIDTFRLLYNIIPDVTNKPYNVLAYSEKYFPIAVLGTRKQIGEKKLEESQRYINTVASNFISQMNLAEGYFVSRDFEKAKDAFSEALTYAKTDEEKFTVYHNLSVIYYEQSDYKTAINYADMANTFTNDNKSDEIKAYSYIEMGKFSLAQRILKNLIEKYPENTTYSAALSGAYLKQFKIFKMFSEMKRIKEINSNALNEPAYSPYKFFASFV